MAGYIPLTLNGTRQKRLGPSDSLLIPSSTIEDNNGSTLNVSAVAGILTTKEPLGFLNRDESKMSFDDATANFSLAPTNTEFTFYNQDNKVVVSAAMTVTISTTEGLHYISIDSTNTLVESTTGFTNIPVALVYYDATNNSTTFLADTRKVVGKDLNSFNINNNLKIAKYVSGLDLSATINGDGSSDSHCQIDLTEGFVDIFDVVQQIVNSTNSDPFNQILSTPANIALYYNVDNAGTIEWRYAGKSAFPVIYDGTNPIKYNNGSSLVTAANNSFVTTYLLLTNNVYNPIIGIIGKNYTTLNEALVNDGFDDYNLNNLGLQYKVLYKLVFKTSTSYTNSPKAIITNYEDYRYLYGNNTKKDIAETIKVDTTNFSKNLSSSDITVQQALETLDQLSAGALLTPDEVWVTFDGSSNTITLPNTPIGKIIVSREGTVNQQEGTDFTISGNVITLSDTAADLNGITYQVFYFYV